MLRRLIIFTVAFIALTAPALASAPSARRARLTSPQTHATGLHHTKLAGPGVTPQTLGLPAPRYYVSSTGTASLAQASVSHPMSLQTALTVVPSGAVVHIASGAYPAVVDFWTRPSWVTFTGAGDATAPTIAGIHLQGAEYVRFADVKFTGQVYINESPYTHGAQPAENIAIIDSEISCGTSTSARAISTAFTQGIYLRGGSRNIAFSGDYVHNCTVGFGSQAQDPLTRNVSITYSTFQDFNGDAIDLGGVSGVVIDHDIIRDMADPGAWYHDDGIQFFGNTSNVEITNNVLANSRVQLIFIQDAVKGYNSGTSVNRNILVAHNLIYGAGGYAVQDQGGQNVSFIGNTMWDNHFGSMLVSQSTYTGLEPTLTLSDNIIQGLGFFHARAQHEDHNLLTDVAPNSHWGAGDIINACPVFVAPQKGNFQIAPQSPGYGRADPGPARALTAGVSELSADSFTGTSRPSVSIGVFQPGDPAVAYGAPSFGPAPLL